MTAPQRPVPVDRERPFGLDELFFSTTDRKGIIRSGNDVFLRVSGLARDQLVGRAHNVVRHPDMPRAVFRAFWDFLGSGRPVGAYVKNLAADGSHYWVMAFAAPVGDAFLSVRFKPTSSLFETVRRIYAAVVAREREVEGGSPRNRKAAVAAGVERLHELLAAEGFETYERFMHAALATELAARRAALGASGHAPEHAGPAAAHGLLATLRACDDAARRLDGLVDELDRLADAGERLADKSAFLLGLAEEIELFSLNAVIASSRLGPDGAALGAVAEIMGRCSAQAGPAIGALHERLERSVAAVGELAFDIAAAKLQADMVAVYLRELIAGGATPEAVAHELGTLAGALAESTERLDRSLRALDESVRAMGLGAHDVDAQLRVVRALEVNGRVEVAALRDGESIRGLFEAIGRQVAAARAQVAEFGDLGRLTSRRGTDDRETLDRVGRAARLVAAVAA